MVQTEMWTEVFLKAYTGRFRSGLWVPMRRNVEKYGEK
jgi:hypothetical protein